MRSAAGLVFLLAVLLPFKLERASLESSLWVDEIYSILLARHSTRQIFDLTAADVHPPGYYLLLNRWLAALDKVGPPPGIFLTRLVNVLIWAVFAVPVWMLGRRLLGNPGGTALAWAVMGSTALATIMRNLRGYAVACPALFLCFQILLELAEVSEDPANPRIRIARLWAAYSILGLVALWTHLLSTLVLGLIGAVWIGMSVRRRFSGKWLVRGGLVAHGVLLLGFLPWASVAVHQLRFLESVHFSWMTPPTVSNGLRVFWLWYPFGSVDERLYGARGWTIAVGVAASALPLSLAFAAALWNGRKPRVSHPALQMGVFGIGIATAFTAILWCLSRLNLAPLFHGPRYPLMTAPFWSGGLVALSLWAVERLRMKPWLVWIPMIPFGFAAVSGQAWSHAKEQESELVRTIQQHPEWFPGSGEPIYVMPSEIIPYLRRSLEGFAVQPAQSLFETSPMPDHAAVLDVSYWEAVDFTRDIILRQAIREKRLSESLEAHRVQSGLDFQVYRLSGIRDYQVRRVLANLDGNRPDSPFPSNVVAVALAEGQFLSDGWSVREVNSDLTVVRWARSERSIIRFDRPVPPGRYILHFEGYRSSYPKESVRMRFRFPGETPPGKVKVVPGSFHLEIPVAFEHRHRELRLHVRHPLWVPAECEAGSLDTRTLAYLFGRAWMDPAPDRDAGPVQ